jgi:hypothetical protein
LRRGKCRFCGCTEERACLLIDNPDRDRLTCAWADAERTVCTNPKCLAKFAKLKKGGKS